MYDAVVAEEDEAAEQLRGDPVVVWSAGQTLLYSDRAGLPSDEIEGATAKVVHLCVFVEVHVEKIGDYAEVVAEVEVVDVAHGGVPVLGVLLGQS